MIERRKARFWMPNGLFGQQILEPSIAEQANFADNARLGNEQRPTSTNS